MTEIEFNKIPQTQKELELFINKYLNRLVHHAFFRIGNKHEAEDIVQDVIVKMYFDKERLSGIENPLSYVYRMVTNACIDFLRKNKTNLIERIELNNYAHQIQVNGHENFMIEEEFKCINNLLSNIPDEQSEVIRFKVIDELSFVEIAAINNLPVTTIKSRFKYGIEKLKYIYQLKKEVNHEMRNF
jgi:RNA polymerase sigma-70 factor, ECF subfamily